MQLLLASLLILSATVGAYAEAQFYPSYTNWGGNFRASVPHPSYAVQEQPENDARFFFATLSLTLATTTISSTTTTTTTCTTSSAALLQCSASGRRRRGVSLDDKIGGRLFYGEEDEDDNVFLPSINEEEKPVEPVVEASRVERQAQTVPFIVQPGFNAPDGNGRVLLSFGTSTVTTTLTATSTKSLVAFCRSTTSFQLCGSSGK